MNSMLRVLILLLKRDVKLRIFFIICCLLAFVAVGLTIKTISGFIESKAEKVEASQTKTVDTKELFDKLHILENKVRENPDDASLHIDLGKLYYKIGEENRAKVELYRAVGLSPKGDFLAKYELVRLYINLGEYQIAKVILSEIPNTRNNDKMKKAELLISLAELAEDNSEYLDAAKMYESALGFYNPESAQYKKIQNELAFVYERVADYYYSGDDISKAVEYLNSSLEKKKTSSAFFKLGLIAEIEGNLDEAVKKYTDAYLLNKEGVNADVYNNALRKRISENRETLSEKDIVQYGLFIKNTDKFVNKTILLKDVRISNVNTEYLRSSGPENSIEAVLKFQVMNISKKSVDKLKIRVIFANDGKVFDFRDIYIANKKHPLEKLSYTSSVSVEAKPIVINNDRNVIILIYTSTSDDDRWVLSKTSVIYI